MVPYLAMGVLSPWACPKNATTAILKVQKNSDNSIALPAETFRLTPIPGDRDNSTRTVGRRECLDRLRVEAIRPDQKK